MLTKSINTSTIALGGFIAVVAGIAGAIALFDHLHISADEARESLSSMQSDYDDTKSNIESLNSELETTRDRIDELNAKENLSLVEQEELSKLQTQNAELKRTLELEEARAKIEARKLVNQAKETYNEWTTEDGLFANSNVSNAYDASKVKQYKNNALKIQSDRIDFTKYNATHFLDKGFDNFGLEDHDYGTFKDNINQLIGSYEALKIEMQNVKEAQDELSSDGLTDNEIQQVDALQNYYDKLEEKTIEVQGYMTDYADVMQEIMTAYESGKSAGIDVSDLETEYKEAKAFLTEYMKMYTGASEVEGGINTLLSKSAFIGVKDELVKAGETSRSVLDSVIAKTPGLTEALDEAGISAQQLGDYIMAIADPDSLRIDGIKQELKDAFETDDYEINFHAGESADAVWNEFISDKSDEEIEVFYKYVNDNGIDISKYSGEDLEATFDEATKNGTVELEGVVTKVDVAKEALEKINLEISEKDALSEARIAQYEASGKDYDDKFYEERISESFEKQKLLKDAQNEALNILNGLKNKDDATEEEISQATIDWLDARTAYWEEVSKGNEYQNSLDNLKIEKLQSQMTVLQDEATKVQDSLSLKEANGIKPLVSDYTKLVSNSEQQVWNLKKQNAELRQQLVGLDINDSKYQEIQSQINANVSAIDQAKIAQIEWNEQASRLRYEPNEGLTAYNKAKSTRNAGDNYLDMMSGLKEAKEAYDAGLIGTDDFKEYARMISPSGATDPANFLENYGKVSEWFTEGADGVKTFLNELDSKGLAEFNEETQQWTYSIEDMAKAANQMGVSEEVMLAMFGRLEDYGFRNNYVSSVEDGVQRLSNLYSDLAKEEALLKEMESKPSEYTDEQVQSKKDLIESIKQNIDETGQSMDYVVANAGETYNTQIESAKSAIESLAEQRKNILDNNLYGENSEAVANQLEKQILGLAEENGLQLDLEYNVVGQEDVTDATNALRTLQENGKISIDLDFNKSDMSADELQQKIDELNETKATINVDDEGGQEALDEINAIINACETEKQLKLALDKGSTVNDLLQLTDEELVNTLQIDTSQVDVAKQRLQEIAEGEEVPITVKIDESQFSELVSNEKQVDITATAHGIEEVQALNKEIDKVQGKTEDVNANVTGTDAVIDLTSEINKVYSKSVTVNAITNGLSQVEALRDSINKLYSKSITVTTNYVENKATGTLKPAHASGTAYNVLNLKPAFANGTNVSIPYDETALINELGTEGLIRDGKLFEIPGGMHYQSLKKGDIILSVEQMRQLSLTGKASGKARAYAYGTVENSIPLMNSYANSTVGGGSFQGGAASSSSTPSTKSLTQAVSNLGNVSTKSTKKVSSLSKALKALEKLFDWVEVKLERLQQSIDYSTAQSENAVGYKNKNSYLSTAQTTTSALISANNAGAKEYKAQADKTAKQVGLSTNLYNKIKNGTIDIQSLSENNKKRVEAVKEWYDKMLDCVQAVEELKASQRDLAQQKFDNITEQYDNMLNHIEHQANMINEYIDQAEAKGYVQSKKYYETLKLNTSEQISEMEAERNALVASLQQSMNEGIIVKDSNEWYEMQSQINDVSEAILEANGNLIDFQNTIREIEWDKFDKGQEAISRLIGENNFFEELMSDEKMFTDKGSVTDVGMAMFGLQGVNYNTYMEQANQYADELKDIEAQLKKDPSNTILINRANELRDSWQDMILSAEDAKSAIVDYVEEGIGAELDALQELIDKRNEAKKSQKDLYDYQKDIEDKTSNISSLEKQLSVAQAMGDTEEGRAKTQELQNSLKEARDDLKETEWEKQLADEEKMLDELYTEYEDILNSRLDNVDQLVTDVITAINENSSDIASTLNEQASAVGYEMTEQLSSVWNNTGDVISTYTTDFSNRMTTLQQSIDGILVGVNNLYTNADTQATSDVTTATTNNASNPSVNTVTSTSSTNTSSTTTSSDKTKDTGFTGSVSGIKATLKKGNKNSNVGKMQKALKKLGYKDQNGKALLIDNWFGPKTQASLKKFQKAMKVSQTGILDYATKEAFAKKGYASGTPYVKQDEWAWTQEEGTEIITLPDGSMLTPLKKGSGVINNPNTEKLLDLADNYDAIKSMIDTLGVNYSASHAKDVENMVKQITASQIVNNSNAGAQNIVNEITFNLPNVKNYSQFMTEMQNDPKFRTLVQTMTLGEANGKSPLNRRKVKW